MEDISSRLFSGGDRRRPGTPTTERKEQDMEDTTLDSSNITVPSTSSASWSPVLIPAMAYTCILLVLGMLGNCLVCYVYGFRWQSTVTKVFIFFLALLDLCNCVICMPTELAMLARLTSFSAPYWCKVTRFLTYLLNGTSSLILVAIAFDRYYKICRPLGYFFTVRRAKLTCCAAMCFAAILSAASLVLYGDFTMQGAGGGQLGRAVGVTCLIADEYIDTHWPLLYYCVYFSCYMVLVLAITVLYTLIARRIIRLRQAQKDRQRALLNCRTPSLLEPPTGGDIPNSRRSSQVSVPSRGSDAGWGFLGVLAGEKAVEAALDDSDDEELRRQAWKKVNASIKKASMKRKAQSLKHHTSPLFSSRVFSVRSRASEVNDERTFHCLLTPDNGPAFAQESSPDPGVSLTSRGYDLTDFSMSASDKQDTEGKPPSAAVLTVADPTRPRRILSARNPHMFADRKDLDPDSRGQYGTTQFEGQERPLLKRNHSNDERRNRDFNAPDQINSMHLHQDQHDTSIKVKKAPGFSPMDDAKRENADEVAPSGEHPETGERDWQEVKDADVSQPLNPYPKAPKKNSSRTILLSSCLAEATREGAPLPPDSPPRAPRP
ncbi:hypothetical protein C0Q70_07543 [Pomacea canaliculata]|uniref:G-protein coupled receptors family 1 profile domain-containing protein n=1 Tax=Pomacea canaliculata TaxID=400727 RepID=A0A2T7PFB0_POMCA|nr:hypothetical protein C0Q70_07543 [Pomacea canaliculata]